MSDHAVPEAVGGTTPKMLHQPVLMDEVMQFLAPRAGGTYCDATVGYGGHAGEILRHSAPDGRLVGIDRDEDAIAAARTGLMEYADRIALVHGRFSEVRAVLQRLGALPLDGCLVDLGVSSPQLDRAERGFSFQRDGALDMRMDAGTGPTAAQLLEKMKETEIAALLSDLGEERYARRIARAVCEVRDRDGIAAIGTTAALAALIAKVVPSRERHKSPATRTFQALRIAVNDEMGELERFLKEAPECLRPGGRLVVIAFHSIEDRIVKHALRALAARGEGESASPRLRLLTKKVVFPTDEEIARNPRARSARLRAAERLAS